MLLHMTDIQRIMVFYVVVQVKRFLTILMITKKGLLDKMYIALFIMLFARRNSFNILQYIQRDQCPPTYFHLYFFVLGINVYENISLTLIFCVIQLTDIFEKLIFFFIAWIYENDNKTPLFIYLFYILCKFKVFIIITTCNN